MKFWDSSAIVTLLVVEKGTDHRTKILQQDSEVIVWYTTPVECLSACMRRFREGSLAMNELDQSLAILKQLEESWIEVSPGREIRTRAERLLRVHPLRAADAFQLAAACVASGNDPSKFDFVCGDAQLSRIAHLEGFQVL